MIDRYIYLLLKPISEYGIVFFLVHRQSPIVEWTIYSYNPIRFIFLLNNSHLEILR